MRAGKLRHRVVIQEEAGVSLDENEDLDQGWQTVATVWAEVEEVSGREQFEQSGQFLTASKRVVFRLRYRAGLTTKMRVKWLQPGVEKARIFDIQEVNQLDGRGREVHLVCEEFPVDG